MPDPRKDLKPSVSPSDDKPLSIRSGPPNPPHPRPKGPTGLKSKVKTSAGPPRKLPPGDKPAT